MSHFSLLGNLDEYISKAIKDWNVRGSSINSFKFVSLHVDRTASSGRLFKHSITPSSLAVSGTEIITLSSTLWIFEI
jgi:hypothetical protein